MNSSAATHWNLMCLLKLQMWKLVATWKYLWCMLKKRDNETYIQTVNIPMWNTFAY